MKQHSADFQEKLEGVSIPPALPAKKYVPKYKDRCIYQTVWGKNGDHSEHDQWGKICSHSIRSAISSHQQVLLIYCFVPEIKQEKKIYSLLLSVTEGKNLKAYEIKNIDLSLISTLRVWYGDDLDI